MKWWHTYRRHTMRFGTTGPPEYRPVLYCECGKSWRLMWRI